MTNSLSVTQDQCCHIHGLPDEIMLIILKPDPLVGYRIRLRPTLLYRYYCLRRVCRRWRDLIDRERKPARVILAHMAVSSLYCQVRLDYTLSRIATDTSLDEWCHFLDAIRKWCNGREKNVARYIPLDAFVEFCSRFQSDYSDSYKVLNQHFWAYSPHKWTDEQLRKTLPQCKQILRHAFPNRRISLVKRLIPLIDEDEYEDFYTAQLYTYAATVMRDNNPQVPDSFQAVYAVAVELLRLRADLFCTGSIGERCFYRCINRRPLNEELIRDHEKVLQRVYDRLWEERNYIFYGQ